MGIISTCPRCGGETYDYACPGCDAETMAELRDKIAELEQNNQDWVGVFNEELQKHAICAQHLVECSNEVVDLKDELALTRAEVVAQTRAKEDALKEVERLKAGEFTDTEFQSLCHQFSPEKLCQFRLGCVQYQSQLFGRAEVQADIARELRYALKQVAHRDGTDRLAELLAEVLMPEVPHE